jgi:putative ABC transport system permease protein
MEPAIIDLSTVDLVLAFGFVAVTLAFSFYRRLGWERELGIGAARTLLQLVLVGYLLRYVFALDLWYVVAGILVIMVVFAGRIAVQRQQRAFEGLYGITTGSIFVVSLVTLGIITWVIINVQPWYEPRYLIPLAGMVIGNAMNGSALAANRLTAEMNTRRAEVEAYLALGGTPRQATQRVVRETMRAAMIPTINSLMSVGIVHLPGVMTGQLLSGTSPLTAVKYQILIMYMLVFVVAFTGIGVVTLGYRKYFTRAMQLREEAVAA